MVINKMFIWEEINQNAAFAPRDGAGLLSFKDKLWLLGGWNPKDKINFPKVCNSEVWSSDDGSKWTLELSAAPWEGRHTAGYAVYKGRMWIIGGDCNQGHYQPDVWSSDDGVSWELICDNIPWGNRALHHTVVFKDRLWVMGGQKMPGFVTSDPSDIIFNDVWCSEDGRSWELVTDNAGWEPRGAIGNSAVFDGRMWIIGGGTYDTPKNPVRKRYNDVWSTKDGLVWECHVKSSAWHPRMYHEIASFNGALWVLEGYGFESSDDLVWGNNMNDVWYSNDGISWTKLENTPWEARHAASVTVHKNCLYVIAGNNMKSDVWKLSKNKKG